jgi:hypothetical protein
MQLRGLFGASFRHIRVVFDEPDRQSAVRSDTPSGAALIDVPLCPLDGREPLAACPRAASSVVAGFFLFPGSNPVPSLVTVYGDFDTSW